MPLTSSNKILTAVLLLLIAMPIFAQQAGVTDPDLSIPVPVLSEPAVGAPFIDPAFGTTITRVTDADTFGTQVYSQLQAFSVDNEYVLLIEDGTYLVRRLSDLSLVPIDNGIMNDIRWHPTDPDTLIFFDSNGDDRVRVQTLNIETDAFDTLYTFPADYVRVRVPQSYEEVSRDGRWIAAMLTRTNESTDIVVADLENQQLGAVLSIDDLYATVCTPDPEWGIIEPDWVGVSPLGNYLIVQWPRAGVDRCRGMEAYNISTGAFVGYVYDNYQHGDLGVDHEGNEIFMTVTLSSPMDPNRPAIATFQLPGNSSAPQPDYLQVMDWGGNHHISCQGPDGACLVTYGGWDDDVWRPFEQEVFLMYTDGGVLRVAHHRSTACGYWVQPRGTISQDGQYAIFASDWGDGCQSADGNGDAYVIQLPAVGGPEEISRIYPAHEQVLTSANAADWPRFTFIHVAGVDWYRVWVGPGDYSATAYDAWHPAFDDSPYATLGAGICDDMTDICTVPADIWLGNDSFAWWMTYWSPAAPAFNAYWQDTTFDVGFSAPSVTVTFTTPADGASVGTAPTQITWDRDPSVLWYRLWVGPADYSATLFFDWVNATAECDTMTCTLNVADVTFADGDYEIWTEVWGPQAYHTWLTVNGGEPSTFSVSNP